MGTLEDKLESIRTLALADISDKTVQGMMTFLDIYIKQAKKAGWSDTYIQLGLANRLKRGEAGVELTSFDKDGNALPDVTPPGQAYADSVTEFLPFLKRFTNRMINHRVPEAEVTAALPRGSAQWRKLIIRWGGETAPDEDLERGSRMPGMTPRDTQPGEPAPTPGERVMNAAKAAGRPVRNYGDYQRAKKEFGGAA